MQVHIVTVLFCCCCCCCFVGLQLFKTLIHIRDLIEWIWTEEGHKPMKDLTPDEQLAYTQATNCHICEQPISSQLTQQEYDKWLEENQEHRQQRRRLLPINLGPKGKLLSPPPPPPHNLFYSQGSLSLDWSIYW